MNVVERREGDILIVGLSGRMTIGQGDAEAGHAIRSALKSGATKIVLDLGEVPLVDSAGLGELISVYALARRRRVAMKLLRLSERVREVLKVTRVIGVFDIFDDEASAIASFG